MIIGLTQSYYPASEARSEELWTADTTVSDLTQASLTYGVASAAECFLGVGRLNRNSLFRTQAGTDLAHVRSINELPRLSSDEPRVFITRPNVSSDLAFVREVNGWFLFPICYLARSAPNPRVMISFLTSMLFSGQQDVLVTHSHTCRKAYQSFMERVREFACARWGAEVKSEVRIEHLPLGVDTQFLAPRPRAWCRELLGLPPAATVALYLGRLTEGGKADLEPLLRVFTRLAGEHAELLLLIAGKDGPEHYAQRVAAMAAACGVGERVKLVVNFPYLLKPVLYSASDLFVSPVDNVQETFGLAVVEAMASGLAVVASDWSGYRDLVLHGETGFLVPSLWNATAGREVFRLAPFADSPEHYLAQRTAVDVEALYSYWKRLVQDQELRQKMGECGRRRALGEYCWSKVAPRYGELWQQQWEQLQRGSRERRPRWQGGFDTAFGQFATEVLGGELEVRCAREGEQLLREPGELRTPAGIGTATVRRLLQACEGRPRLVKELLDESDPETASALSWLLKLGYLKRQSLRDIL